MKTVADYLEVATKAGVRIELSVGCLGTVYVGTMFRGKAYVEPVENDRYAWALELLLKKLGVG